MTKLTESEKLQRAHERRAAKLNAKERDEAGMFADVPGVIEEVTAQDMYWRWRRDKAQAAEHVHQIHSPEMRGMGWIELQAIERWAAELIGVDVAAKLAAYIRDTYPMPNYGKTVWQGVLCGEKRIVYSWLREIRPDLASEYNREGIRLVADGQFPPDGWIAPITREQFWARFPYAIPVLPDHDDAGLFDRVMAAVVGRVAA